MKYVLVSLFFLSCAHKNEMASYKKNLSDAMKSVVKDYKVESPSRKIASTSKFENLGNREIYFSHLYSQYKHFQNLTGKGDEIKSCPAFHQVLLSTNIKNDLKEEWLIYSDQEAIKGKNSLAFYPELNLPIKNGKVVDYVTSKNSQSLILEALTEYNKNNEEELLTLCETGFSSNYYIYENIVSYYSQDKAFITSDKAMEAFVKVPLVANAILLDRLQRNKAHGDELALEESSLNRLGATWFRGYLYTLHNLRNNIPVKMYSLLEK